MNRPVTMPVLTREWDQGFEFTFLQRLVSLVRPRAKPAWGAAFDSDPPPPVPLPVAFNRIVATLITEGA
jgi:hypothetical protein